eukprot:6079984-Heterocapsa_arctica.AAC.1
MRRPTTDRMEDPAHKRGKATRKRLRIQASCDSSSTDRAVSRCRMGTMDTPVRNNPPVGEHIDESTPDHNDIATLDTQ